MPRVNVEVDTLTIQRTIQRKSCTVGRALLIELLAQARVVVPPDAEVFIRVPGGGGDWSNHKLSLDENNVEITWKEQT